MGGAILSARWLDLKGERTWRAPGGAKAAENPGAGVVQLADWLRDQVSVSPGKPELLLVLDTDGAACGWLTAPSAEPGEVRAAVRDLLNQGEDDGASSLSWMEGKSPGADTSVQAIGATATLEKRAKGRGKGAIGRERLGLVALADLPVRLLVDELDKRQVMVRRVLTVWHAMAQVEAGPRSGAPRDARVVSADEPVSATVMLTERSADAKGELLWTWSRAGTLLCAGSLRLRETVDAGSRSSLRLAAGDRAGEAGASVVEVTIADVGRLVTDWLGWSLESGHAPARIMIVGPRTVTCSGLEFDLPEMLGVSAVGAGLGKAWPGAAVQATMDDDPIGAVLRRLVDVESDESLDARPLAVDPGASVVDLSTRPGRTSRWLHLWGGLALLAAAVAVGVLGWRTGRATEELRGQIERLKADRASMLTELAKGPMGIRVRADDPDPVLTLQGRLTELNNQRKELKDEDPVLAEVQRFLRASQGLEGVQLVSLQVQTAQNATAELSVPIEGDQGPAYLERVQALRSGASKEVSWNGRTIGVTGNRRRFNMSGLFRDVPKSATPVKSAVPVNTPTPAAAEAAPVAPVAPAASPPTTAPVSAPTSAPAPTTEGAPTPPAGAQP
jgi:hypothetical protein